MPAADCVMSQGAAAWILSQAFQMSTSFRPEAPRKQRCIVLRSIGGSGGVMDMEVFVTAEWWHKAVVKAIEKMKQEPS